MSVATTQRRKVLVVEDDSLIRAEVTEALQGEGFEVLTAENGLEALSRLRMGAPPCVILLDLMMPVMDGWTFRNEQLKEAALADVPVVVMSGTRNVAKEAAGLGAAGYLMKPYTVEKLIGAIEGWCR